MSGDFAVRLEHAENVPVSSAKTFLCFHGQCMGRSLILPWVAAIGTIGWFATQSSRAYRSSASRTAFWRCIKFMTTLIMKADDDMLMSAVTKLGKIRNWLTAGIYFLVRPVTFDWDETV